MVSTIDATMLIRHPDVRILTGMAGGMEGRAGTVGWAGSTNGDPSLAGPGQRSLTRWKRRDATMPAPAHARAMDRGMAQESAGILLYQRRGATWHVLLAHPGGPFWRHRDTGAWMLPKGGIDPGESAEAAARREFEEELGAPATGTLLPLGKVRQRGGKWVEAFAMEGDFDVAALRSNHVPMEWPPRTGRFIDVPEVDRAEWFSLDAARAQILPSQAPLLDRLEALLAAR
jgi:predicted NUDIX family NTP pyrophosphohydrolase